jgi:hypothetical protein
MGSQQGYQQEIDSNLLFWNCRNPLLDRIVLKRYSYAIGDPGYAIGPTGNSDALILTGPATITLNGPVTPQQIQFWAQGNFNGDILQLIGGNTLHIGFDAGSLRIAFDGGDTVSFPIVSDDNWHLYTVVISEATVTMFQDGLQIGTQATESTFGPVTQVALNPASNDLNLFDIRGYSAVVSLPSMAYYLTDVQSGGLNCLPL